MYFFYARINSRGLNRILLRVQNYTHLQTNITSGCEVKTYFGLDHNHVSPSVAFMGFISPHSSCFQEPGGRKPQNNSVLVSELHTWQNCILFTDCPLDEYVLRQLILWILWHKYIFFGDWSFYGKPSSCSTEGHTAAEGQENQNSTVFCWNEHSVLQLNLANREIENNCSSPKSSPRRKEAAELFFFSHGRSLIYLRHWTLCMRLWSRPGLSIIHSLFLFFSFHVFEVCISVIDDIFV